MTTFNLLTEKGVITPTELVPLGNHNSMFKVQNQAWPAFMVPGLMHKFQIICFSIGNWSYSTETWIFFIFLQIKGHNQMQHERTDGYTIMTSKSLCPERLMVGHWKKIYQQNVALGWVHWQMFWMPLVEIKDKIWTSTTIPNINSCQIYHCA